MVPEKRRVGIVFQDYALFPHLSVKSNVAFGLSRREREERERITQRTLELVGLQHKADEPPPRALGWRAPAGGAGARARPGARS